MNALSALKAPLMGALLGLCALRAVAGEAAPAAPVPPQHGELSTIAALDVPRYMGTWFEIAKYPNWFQKKCTGGGTTAQYRQQADGTVQVINRCRLEIGAMNEAMATARQVGSATSPKLKVRFAPSSPPKSVLSRCTRRGWISTTTSDALGRRLRKAFVTGPVPAPNSTTWFTSPAARTMAEAR